MVAVKMAVLARSVQVVTMVQIAWTVMHASLSMMLIYSVIIRVFPPVMDSVAMEVRVLRQVGVLSERIVQIVALETLLQKTQHFAQIIVVSTEMALVMMVDLNRHLAFVNLARIARIVEHVYSILMTPLIVGTHVGMTEMDIAMTEVLGQRRVFVNWVQTVRIVGLGLILFLSLNLKRHSPALPIRIVCHMKYVNKVHVASTVARWPVMTR